MKERGLRIGNVVCRKLDYGQEEVIINKDNIGQEEEFSGILISTDSLVKILGFSRSTFYVLRSGPAIEEIMYDLRDEKGTVIKYTPEGQYNFEIQGVAKFNVSYIHQLQNIIIDLLGYVLFRI